MRGARGTILALALLSAALLLAIPASAVSADTVKIYYQDVQGIQVDFPNGRSVEEGGELIIVTSSNIYDMERSGIMFYERGPDGKPDMTTSVTPNHSSSSEGNVVTHIFSNLTQNIEMHFTELKTLETPGTGGGDSGGGSGGGSGSGYVLDLDIGPAVIVAIVAAILSAAMLAVMTVISGMVNRTLRDLEAAS